MGMVAMVFFLEPLDILKAAEENATHVCEFFQGCHRSHHMET